MVATHTIVPYQSPQARATAATGKALIGFLSAFAVVGVPVIVTYLNTQAASTHNTVLALAYTLGALFLGVVLTYAVNYAHASGSDTPPTVSLTPMQYAPLVEMYTRPEPTTTVSSARMPVGNTITSSASPVVPPTHVTRPPRPRKPSVPIPPTPK